MALFAANKLFQRDILLGWSLLRRGLCAELNRSREADSGAPSPSFDSLYTTLSEKVKGGNYLKATDLNTLFYKCKSVDELEKAKDILAWFRRTASFSRSSQPIVVIRACLELDMPHKALHIIKDPVKYGIFPKKNAFHTLLMAFVQKQDTEGIKQTIQLMQEREVKLTGMQHFLLAKTTLKNLLDVREGSGSVASEGEEPERKGVASEGEAPERKGVGSENEVSERENVASEGKEADITLESLKPVLKLCQETMAISLDYGSRSFYFVNGKLLALGMVELSLEMLDKLETEGDLPENLLLTMHIDNKMVSGDLAGVLSLLHTLLARDVPLSSRHIARLTEVFDSCEDSTLQSAFKKLELELRKMKDT